MSLPSLDDMPSVPSATLTSWSSRRGTGQIPLPSFMFEIGLWTIVVPVSRTISMSRGVSQMPCSKFTRGPRKPSACMCSGSVLPYILRPDSACIRVSSTWMWICRSSSSASAAHDLQERVGAALRPRRTEGDRDPLVRAVVALDGVPGEGLPLVPGRRLVLLQPVDQRPVDQALVEHDGLVVGPIAHPEHDQRAEPQVAIGLDHRGERSSVNPAIS